MRPILLVLSALVASAVAGIAPAIARRDDHDDDDDDYHGVRASQIFRDIVTQCNDTCRPLYQAIQVCDHDDDDGDDDFDFLDDDDFFDNDDDNDDDDDIKCYCNNDFASKFQTCSGCASGVATARDFFTHGATYYASRCQRAGFPVNIATNSSSTGTGAPSPTNTSPGGSGSSSGSGSGSSSSPGSNGAERLASMGPLTAVGLGLTAALLL